MRRGIPPLAVRRRDTNHPLATSVAGARDWPAAARTTHRSKVSMTRRTRSSLTDRFESGWVAMSKSKKFCFSVRRTPYARVARAFATPSFGIMSARRVSQALTTRRTYLVHEGLLNALADLLQLVPHLHKIPGLA